MSKDTFASSPGRFFEAVDFMLQGIAAYERNFWWSLMLRSSLVTSAVLSLLVSLLVVVIVRLPSDLSLLSHDIGEEKKKVLLLFGLVLAVFGPLFLLGGVLLLIIWYHKKGDRLVFFVYVVLLLVSPWLFTTMSTIMNASTSGAVKAVVRVNESRDNTYALSVLNGSRDPVEVFSYALALKREGRYRDAVHVNEGLLAQNPDARVYINLGNAYLALHEPDKAIDLYKKSLQMIQTPSALYNLSQVHREILDFERGEEYFLSAQKLDSAAVSRYRAIYSRNPNRFVIDETVPRDDIYRYSKTKRKEVFTAGLSLLPPPMIPLAGVFFAAFYFLANAFFKTWSYRCARCGKILCTKCERHVLWGHMCLQCYRSLIKLDELDAKERVARLLAVYAHQNRRRNTIKLLSFLLPGSGLIYGGNILTGFCFLWLSLFSVALLLANSFFKAEMHRYSHVWLNGAAVILLVVIYIVSAVVTRRRLAKGWL